MIEKFRLWNNAGDKSKMFYDTEQVMECLKQQMLFDDKEHKYHKLGFDHIGNGSSFMQHSGLKGFQGDIADVCIFLVSPSNPDNDQHFRGVIGKENGKFIFTIHKYLKFDGSKSEWINIRAKDLPFYDEELDEDGTYTVTYYDFLAMSSNLGEFCDDNVEIIGNVFENPELLNGRHEA